MWEITGDDEQNLDRYEGFPNFYYKKDLTVPINGKQEKAMVYIMDEQRHFGEPGHWYYSTLENAYIEFGFDLSILEKALKDTITEGDGDVY